MKYISKNEKETRKIAADFAKQLRGGEVILMYGDLGAGKTVFAKGLAKALGVREVVKSPTFNIMKCYKVHLPPCPTFTSPNPSFERRGTVRVLCHIDAYRLKNFDDLLDIGAEEYLGKENVITVIEWAERIDGYYDNDNNYNNDKKRIKMIRVKIEHGKKYEEREIIIN